MIATLVRRTSRPRTAARPAEWLGLAAVVAGLAVAACTSGSGPADPRPAPLPPSITETTTGADIRVRPDEGPGGWLVRTPPERAFEAVRQAYRILEVPVEASDPENRTLGHSGFTVTRRLGGTALSTFLNCGMGATGPNANRFRIRLTIQTWVTPAPEGFSSVETRIDAVGRNVEGTSNTAMACTSTGRLEQRIVELVKRQLGL